MSDLVLIILILSCLIVAVLLIVGAAASKAGRFNESPAVGARPEAPLTSWELLCDLLDDHYDVNLERDDNDGETRYRAYAGPDANSGYQDTPAEALEVLAVRLGIKP